jgi:REP element-mobilizing transposase RayT
MPQSLASVLIHLVFSTKHRQPFITPAIETELHKYMATVFRGCDSPALLVGGYEDHIHALFLLSRKWAIADVVEEVKTSSSKWIKTKGAECAVIPPRWGWHAINTSFSRAMPWAFIFGAFGAGEI